MTVLYIHGKGGSADESSHYEPLFPGGKVTGLDYRDDTPREAEKEIRAAAEKLQPPITLIANSIGAFFAMHAGIDSLVEKAYFISPIVDLEKLIGNMMKAAGISENALREKREIPLSSGETLSWDYLQYIRSHSVSWAVPTEILCGGRDALTTIDDMTAFAAKVHAKLTVMEDGEHWFHTEAQMKFLDQWITKGENNHANKNA